MKVNNSWTKQDEGIKTPSRKKVDYSMINECGSVIPMTFRSEFPCCEALSYEEGKREVSITLIYNNQEYEGKIDIEQKGRTRIWIRSKELKDIIKDTFYQTLEYVQEQRQTKDKGLIIVPDELAEYIEFYRTGEDDTYIIELITRGNSRSTCFGIDIKAVNEFMNAKGIYYSEETLSNFYLSIKSKPFAILSGISGTGKSKLVRLFANAIGAEFIPIPVRPDWSDATELIGYKDLNQVFHPGSLAVAIQNAKQQPDKPFIVCLDEMNLARVEYYFSDFLSLIESRRKEGDHIITDCFPQDFGDEPLTLPDNLYVVGTVNMDETTFQFSKKVLDRANTIELSEVDLSYDFDQTFEDEVAPLNVHNNALKSEYLLLKDCKAYKALAERIITKLIAINEILTPARLEFAYRVRDEIIFYMVYNEEYGLLSEEEAFDLQLLQKILPRITGTSRKVELLLMRLIDLWTDETISIKDLEDTVEDGQVLSKAYYPRSVKKLLQMLRGYRDDGFTSFW